MDGMNGLGRSCAVTAFRRQTLSASNCCCCGNPQLMSGKSPSHLGNVLHLWWDIPVPLLLGPSLKMNVLSKAV